MTSYYDDCKYCDLSYKQIMEGKDHSEECPLFTPKATSDEQETNFKNLSKIGVGYD